MTPLAKAKAVAEAQDILGVPAYASEPQIREAWKKLAFEMHPDRGVGSNDQLANINAAYSLLKDRCESGQTNADYWEKAKAQTRPASQMVKPRPGLKTKTDDLGDTAKAECQALLDENEAPETGTADHLPVSIRRRGRDFVYIVETGLNRGMNRIAVPTGDLVNSRRVTPRLVNFMASANGAGSFNVPDDLRAKLFPGARSVRIDFAKTEH
ncbi:MAG: DnaJ domain-containing protein [Boseongicola sp.]|nr:MAG: DnaJ domain-containing protein [Boseongicola sp.]